MTRLIGISRWTWSSGGSALALLLAILLHLAISPVRISKGGASSQPTIEITSIDPGELAALRRQFKKTSRTQSQDLIVSNQAAAKDAPENARAISDRNIRVEREQRARTGGVLPDRRHSKKAPLYAPPDPDGFMRSKTEPSDEADSNGAEDQEQAVARDDLKEGDQTLLNARESIYYSFYLRIRESVGLLWQSLAREAVDALNLTVGSYRTSVEAVLDSSGELLEVNLLETSSYSPLDLAVEEAWRRVKRFPNPPQGLIESDGKVHLKWSFTVELGNDGVLLRPPRRLRRD